MTNLEMEKAIEEGIDKLFRWFKIKQKIKIRKLKLKNERLKKQYEKIKDTKKYKRALKKAGKKLRKWRKNNVLLIRR